MYRNINACKELSQVTRTSLGPNGKNKMIVNNLEKLFVTNDAATIMKEMEVIHPAARLLVMASEQQQKEVGDASNFVIVFAGELLQLAEGLLKLGLHPNDVVEGYKKASKKALELLDCAPYFLFSLFFTHFPLFCSFAAMVVKTIGDLRDRDTVIAALRSSIASKQFGYEDFLSALVTDACLSILPASAKQFNLDNIRVIKVMGAGLTDSTWIRGMVFEREPDSTIQRAENAKVAIFTCSLDIMRTETKGTVLLHNSEELMSFSKGEEVGLETAIKEIADAGVKVVVTGSGIGELALHFINRYNLMALKVHSKFDLRRLCKATGATALARLGGPTPEEIGHCDLVETTEIGGDRVTVFRQKPEDESAVATIVIRGATKNMMDDVERAVDDAVNSFRVLTRDPRVLAGAAAVEIELANQLASLGEKTPGLEQYSIKKFAEAFEVIPRTLAENAGLDVRFYLVCHFVLTARAEHRGHCQALRCAHGRQDHRRCRRRERGQRCPRCRRAQHFRRPHNKVLGHQVCHRGRRHRPPGRPGTIFFFILMVC